MRILGIDLGKSNSAWRLLDTVTHTEVSGTVAMDDASLQKLLQKTQPELLAIEIGPMAARVHDLAVAAGVQVQVADTTQDAWQWKNVKRKTDADDAAKLTRLAALEQINPVHIPPLEVREQRHLQEYRRSLVADRTACKNRIRATLLLKGLRILEDKYAWGPAWLKELAEVCKPLKDCGVHELWRGQLHVELEHFYRIDELIAVVTNKLDELAEADKRVDLLRSIPGVGPRTAEVIVAVLDKPERFASARQVSAYAGLVPRRYQSGRMDHSGRITKRGSPMLRQTLNQAAWVAVRCNPRLREFYLRVSRGAKKRSKQAIVAVMRKLLVIAWAMLRDARRYGVRSTPAANRPMVA